MYTFTVQGILLLELLASYCCGVTKLDGEQNIWPPQEIFALSFSARVRCVNRASSAAPQFAPQYPAAPYDFAPAVLGCPEVCAAALLDPPVESWN